MVNLQLNDQPFQIPSQKYKIIFNIGDKFIPETKT
ncbi:MAG: hypothetical protein PWR15_1500 [Bacteroidota bacterium]|jgi:hypothetical protein|nr:hypothetical protein [Bacteroidota bacterium]